MAKGGWYFDPDSGGQKIPERVKVDIKKRIETYAAAHFAGKYTRLDIRFRGQFCYIDAYTQPLFAEGWPPADWPETREQYEERRRNTPTHLCRLRYFRDEKWGFAFFTYSNEKYSLSMYANGEFFGQPEEAFHLAAQAYLA